jgi:hypothetical protein
MKSHFGYTLLALFFLFADARRIFVDPAPLKNEQGW